MLCIYRRYITHATVFTLATDSSTETPPQGGTLRTWSLAFAERFVGKGRGQWAASDPWGVALKPEIIEGKGPPGPADAETPADLASTERQDDAA